MNFRTDLALEKCENLDEKSLEGIRIEVIEKTDAKITRIDVLNEKGEKTVGNRRAGMLRLK